jgi:hypothetical protein
MRYYVSTAFTQLEAAAKPLRPCLLEFFFSDSALKQMQRNLKDFRSLQHG